MNSYKELVLGLALVFFGLFAGGLNLFNTWQSQKAAAQPVAQAFKSNNNVKTGDKILSGIPTRIQIPSVGIDLKVIPGYYNSRTNSWTLSLDKAQYAVMTVPANNHDGDTFIYAHYRKGVFLTLPKILPGAKAIVATGNGHTFTYKFTASEITKPSDGSLFKYKGKPILILQTCTGVHFQNRQLFSFDLVGVE